MHYSLFVLKMLVYNVEDDANLRGLVMHAVRAVGFETESFERAEDMLAAFNRRVPDMVILDIMLEGMSGVEALRAVKSRYPHVKAIMLTAKTGEVNKVDGLDSGADDYITKPFSVLELQARVRAHLRGRGTIPLAEAEKIVSGDIVVDMLLHRVYVSGVEIMLTDKEFELLSRLVKNVGSEVTRETLLKDVWGYEYAGESRTIDSHIKNLRTKLGASGSRVKSIRGVGYILR